MTRLAVVCVSLWLCACAADAGPLCDGSTDIRFAAYSGGGGPLPDGFQFTNPSGHPSLLVDGKCQFFVEDNSSNVIVRGTLSPSDAEQLMRDVHWSELASWSYPWKDDESCPDAGFTAIAGAEGFGGCSCGCDPGAPDGLNDALSKTYAWSERLAAQGQPVDGPVSAVALDRTEADEAQSQVKGVMPSFADWPLERAMSSIPGLIQQDVDMLMDGAFFDDASDIAKLRALRASIIDTRAGIPVEENARTFRLYIRDELPEAVEASWERRRVTLPL